MKEQKQKKIRWGILGAGDIVSRWMRGARQLEEEMEIVGIASRTPDSAGKAADRYGIRTACTYEELLEREDIDVFYVATPHTAHKDLTLEALRRGKGVLVEKPAGINASEFAEMVQCAREHDAFLMEAIWTDFFPVIAQIREQILEGRIGEVRMIESSFSYRCETSATYKARIFDPATAGGGLLDVGVYNLHLAQTILGKEPQTLTGLASFDTDEDHIQVDEQAACMAQYDRGELAVMTCGIRTKTIDTAYIYGTKGHIVLPSFWKPTKYRLFTEGREEIYDIPVPQKVWGCVDEGYQYEIHHVNQCIRDGVRESSIARQEKTLSILRQCDTLRRQWGFSFPSEQ